MVLKLGLAFATGSFALPLFAILVFRLGTVCRATFWARVEPLGGTLRDGALRLQIAALERGMIGGVAIGAERRVGHRQDITEHFHRAVSRDGVDVLPSQLALSGHLEEVAFGIGAEECAAVGQSLGAGANVTKKAVPSWSTTYSSPCTELMTMWPDSVL